MTVIIIEGAKFNTNDRRQVVKEPVLHRKDIMGIKIRSNFLNRVIFS